MFDSSWADLLLSAMAKRWEGTSHAVSRDEGRKAVKLES